MPKLFYCLLDGKTRCLTEQQAKDLGAEILSGIFPMF